MRTLIHLLLSLSLAGTICAQPSIFIVDELGGPGSHYTDLPQAVAAVPDGSVLVVRPGSYSSFVMDGKGLTIAGEDGATVSGLTLSIQNTAPGQPVLLRNLYVEGFFGTSVRVIGARDAVIFEEIRVDTQVTVLQAFHFVIQDSTNVQLHRCSIGVIPSGVSLAPVRPRIDATDSTLQISHSTIFGGPGPRTFSLATGINVPGGPAVTLVRSRCIAVASTLTGGLGGPGCSSLSLPGCAQLSGPGGTGVVVADSSVFYAMRTPVIGGPGVPAFDAGLGAIVDPSEGGDGIHVTSGSLARFEGAMPIPGVAGTGVGLPGPPAVPSVVEAGSILTVDTTTYPPAGEIVGTQATGETVRFTLDAEPGSVGLLLLGYRADLLPLEPLAPGSLLAAIALHVGPVPVPATGTARLPFAIPSMGWPIGQTYYGQFVTLEVASGRLWTSNSFPWHTNR